MLRKEFKIFNLDIILSNWKAYMIGRPFKVKKQEQWSPPPAGVLQFNVDGAARGKPGPVGIGGVLRNHEGIIFLSFSSSIEVKDSNEAEVLAILEALRLFRVSFRQPLIVDSDFLDAFFWVKNSATGPWKFHFFPEIKFLSSDLVEFRHFLQLVNGEVDMLAKRGASQ